MFWCQSEYATAIACLSIYLSQMSSLIPKNIPYGVFVGLLHRGYRICSDVEDFLSDALVKARTLLTNGCKRNLLKRRFKQFVHQHVQKYT